MHKHIQREKEREDLERGREMSIQLHSDRRSRVESRARVKDRTRRLSEHIKS